MAIKVKHEGNVASRATSSAAGGAAKRAMEAAAFAKGRDIQQKQAASAHASAPGAPGAPTAHAQLISAPSGGHVGLIGGGGGVGSAIRFGGGSGRGTGYASTARPSASHIGGVGGDGIGGAGGRRGRGLTSFSKSSGKSAPETPKKVTGSSIFDRPDDASVWNPIKGRWEREYLPGEYEAEAKDRIMGAEYGWKQAALNEDAAREKVAADEAQERRNKEYDFRHRKEMEAADNASTLRNKEYTFKQKADWANLEQAYQDAAASGRYTPQELEVLRTQVDLQKANIKGNPFEALEPKQTAQQDIDSRLVMVNGQQMYRNSKGDLELVPTAPQNDDGFGDFVKMYPKMTKTVMQEQMDANGKIVNVPIQVQMTPEEAISAWNKMKAGWGNTDMQESAAQEERPLYGPRATPTPDYYGDLKKMNPFVGYPISNSSPQDAAMKAVATGGDPVVAARQAAEVTNVTKQAQAPVATTNAIPQAQAPVPAAVDNGANTNAAPVQADAQQVNAETNAPSATTPEDRWAKYERTDD